MVRGPAHSLGHEVLVPHGKAINAQLKAQQHIDVDIVVAAVNDRRASRLGAPVLPSRGTSQENTDTCPSLSWRAPLLLFADPRPRVLT